jgi:hypothetical protein
MVWKRGSGIRLPTLPSHLTGHTSGAARRNRIRDQAANTVAAVEPPPPASPAREPVTHSCISARSPLRDLLSKALGHGHVSV